jgi:hypothetical protein
VILSAAPGSMGGSLFAQSSGHGSVSVQSQSGSGNRQSVVQTGQGNVAIQKQSGNGLNGALIQQGGDIDLQMQGGE